MFLQRMQSIEEHQLVKLIDKLSEYFLAQIRSRFFIIKENYPTVDFCLT